MRVPRGEQAVVPENKIRDYLLSLSHPEGRSKARFFIAFGFNPSAYVVLAQALKAHVMENDAGLSKRNEYGTFYNVDGPLKTPDGRNPIIRSAWVVEAESSPPRLITAHPFMTSELDVVVLTEAVREHSLEKGDVGTVVHVFGHGEACEVEFVTLKGATVAVVTLKSSQFRPVGNRDMTHVRNWGSDEALAA